MAWWKAILLVSDGSCSLKPHKHIDPDIWVDASTTWGIGIVIGDHWAAWQLSVSWKKDDRDIGWAEAIALDCPCCGSYNKVILIVRSRSGATIPVSSAPSAKVGHETFLVTILFAVLRPFWSHTTSQSSQYMFLLHRTELTQSPMVFWVLVFFV